MLRGQFGIIITLGGHSEGHHGWSTLGFPDILNIPAFPEIPEISELPEVPEMPEIPEIPAILELLHRFCDQFSLFFEVTSRERLDSRHEGPNLRFC